MFRYTRKSSFANITTSLNPNSRDNKGSCWILKDFYCSVTMLRELGLKYGVGTLKTLFLTLTVQKLSVEPLEYAGSVVIIINGEHILGHPPLVAGVGILREGRVSDQLQRDICPSWATSLVLLTSTQN